MRRVEVTSVETVWVFADDRQRLPAESAARLTRNAAVVFGVVGLNRWLANAREALLMCP